MFEHDYSLKRCSRIVHVQICGDHCCTMASVCDKVIRTYVFELGGIWRLIDGNGKFRIIFQRKRSLVGLMVNCKGDTSDVVAAGHSSWRRRH